MTRASFTCFGHVFLYYAAPKELVFPQIHTQIIHYHVLYPNDD